MKNKLSILLVLILSLFFVDCGKKKKSPLLFLPGMGGEAEAASENQVAASVNGATLSSISINPSTKTIYKETSTDFTAVASYDDGTVKDVTDSVEWTTTDESISHKTDIKGRFKGLVAGSTKIKASFQDKEGVADLVVSTSRIASVSILPSNGDANNTIHTGSTTKYTVIIILEDGTRQDVSNQVEWSVVGGNITVSNSGEVTGVSQGSSTLLITLKDPNNPNNTLATSSLPIVVSSSPLQSILVNVASNTPSGLTTNISVVGVFADGSTQDLTSSVSLVSSNPQIVSIQNGHNITIIGTQVGSSTITASLGGVSTQVVVNITEPVIQSISIESNQNSIAAGYGTNLKAIATMSDGTTRDVTNQITWTSNNPSILTITSGVNGGTVNTISEGNATITASLFDKTASYNFTVQPATLVSLAISNSNSIPKGMTQSMTVIGTYSDGSTQVLTNQVLWTSSNSGVATVSNINGSNGTVSAVGLGSATITASINGISTSKVVNISSALLSSISISPVNVSLAKGQTQQFIATGTYSDGTTQNITNSVLWTSGNNSIANVVTSSENAGKVTASGLGSTTITASKDGASISVAFSTTAATITSLSVLSPHESVAKGLHEAFQAFATYTDGTIIDVTSQVLWTSSNTNIATISNLEGSSKGTISTIGTGSVVITASIGSVSSSKTITVNPAVLQSIEVQSSSLETPKGIQQQFTAIGTYSDGSRVDITKDVTWIADSNGDGIDDNLVASISNVTSPQNTKGLLTTNSTGSVNIIANLNGVGSGGINFTVKPARIDSITISPLVVTLQVGSNVQFLAEALYSDGTKQIVTESVVFKADSNNDGIDDNNVVIISNLNGSIGKATATAIGSATITGTINGVSSIASITTSEAVSTTVTIDDKNVTIPNGVTTVTPPTGDYDGVVYNGGTNLAGSVSIIPDYGQQSCTTLGSHILNMILEDTPDRVATSTQVSSNNLPTVDGCSMVYNLTITTNSPMKPTELSNHLITIAGTNRENGVVSSLPSNQSTETNSSEFRVILQVTYSSTGSELIGIGVSSSAEYAYNESILDNFLDGTNVAPAGTVYLSRTDSFTGSADPKVDFLWVVDNSGSMEGEQASVQNAATTFFNKLANKHLDYKLGVITTGSDGTNDCSKNLSEHPSRKAWILWGPNRSTSDRRWVGASDGISAFTSRVNVGLGGCGEETGSFFAKYALETRSVTPRSDAKLVIVMVSDEGDYYQCWTGGTLSNKGNGVSPTFNPCQGGTSLFGPNDSNFFKTNNYKVYSIIGLNPNTNLPGTCRGTGTNSATTSNNRFDGYYRLANSTGGSASSICTDDFNPIMNSITNNAAGTSSSYVLTKLPQSSTIYVKVNGQTIQQNAVDGWSYNSASNSIIFSGSAWPLPGSDIQITYQFDPNQVAFKDDSSFLLAFLKRSVNTPISLIVMIGLLSTTGLLMRRKLFK